MDGGRSAYYARNGYLGEVLKNLRIPLAVLVVMGGCWATAAQPTVEQLMRDGLMALQRGDSEQAISQLEAAVSAAPKDFRPWMALAQARRMSGDMAGAEHAITQALEFTPQTPQTAHAFAMYFAEGGEFEKAGEFEARLARAAPDAPEVFLRTASWYLQGGKPALAVQFARSGLERGESAALFDVLGKALAETGELDEAEQALRSAIRLDPYDEELRYNLGYLYLQATQFDEAVAAFEEGREVFDKSPQLELGIGVARFAQRRFDEAVDAFLLVSRLAPGLEQPHYFLSRSLEHAADRIPEVRQRFDAFSAARPEHYLGPFLQAKGLLASLGPARDTEKLAEAEALLRASIERRDNYWESHFELGVVLDRLRRFEEARDELLRAIEISPSSATPHYRLSRVYQRLGEPELAEKEAALHEKLVADQRTALSGGGMQPPILSNELEAAP